MLLDLRFLYETPAAAGLTGGGRVLVTTMHPPLPVVGRGNVRIAAAGITAVGRTLNLELIALLLSE